MQPELHYHEEAVRYLRRGRLVSRGGFQPERITCHGPADNHRSLMVITKENWTLHTEEGAADGYAGVNVHYESNGPGDLKLHCELYPRRGSESKKDRTRIQPLLELKGEISRLIREIAQDEGWHTRFGAHQKRTAAEPSDPKALMVLGFDLGLPAEHDVEAFCAKVEGVVLGTHAGIQTVLVDQPS